MNAILTPGQLQRLAEEALIITGAPIYLEPLGPVLYWQQGDPPGEYLGPEGQRLERVELGLAEDGVAAPAEPEPGTFYAGEEYPPLTHEEVTALLDAHQQAAAEQGDALPWLKRADELRDWQQHGAPTRTMICMYLTSAPPPWRANPIAAEVNADDVVYCTGCGESDGFVYRERIDSERPLRANEDRRLVFAGSSEDGDGDDDPGVMCERCERPVLLPAGVDTDWMTW
jgi:hypothetical protein